MLDDIKDTYTEAISTALPLHRVFVVAFGFLCAVAVAHQSYLSIIETVLRFQISDLSFETDKLFERATLFDCLWGLALCFFSFCCQKLLANCIFLLISKSIDYDKRIAEQRQKFAWMSAIPYAERSSALIRIEKKKKEQQKK